MKIGAVLGLVLVLLCCGCPTASAAQEVYLLGGPVIANLGGDAELFGDALAASIEQEIGGTWESQKQTRLGFDIGAGFSYMGPGIWGAAGEVRYVSRGVKWEINELTGSGLRLDSAMKLDYVEIPLLLQLAPQTTGSVRPVFVAGPVLGIRASSKFEVEVQGQSASEDIEGLKGTYFGALLGAGMKIRTTEKSSVLLQARFQLGLSNLVDDPNYSIDPQDFSILAGYAVGF
jgi:hypothetical protein